MDARTVAEGGPQAPAALYAQAVAREMKFTHFSASRNDTRAQFRRWFSAEPAGPPPDRRFQSSSTLVFGLGGRPTIGSSFRSSPDLRTPGMIPQAHSAPMSRAETPGGQISGESGSGAQLSGAQQAAAPVSESRRHPLRHQDDSEILPQWLSVSRGGGGVEREPGGGKGGIHATSTSLADAGAPTSSRWLLLNEVVSPSSDSSASPDPAGGGAPLAPALLAFSIAGGTGKTTALATLGRALAARGERILLTDTARFSLAPCYFGAAPGGPVSAPVSAGGPESAGESAGRAAGVRTFSPPAGSGDAPVNILLLPATGRRAEDRGAPDAMREALLRHGGNADRILVDIQSGSESAVRRLLWLEPWVLVPLLPDMNSVATVAAVERAFATGVRAGGATKLVWLLNQYDPTLPLHLDVRAALEGQLGERLLPFVLRRCPEVSEALAEGMTVVDYAPNSPAAEDYARLADWLRAVAPASSHGLRRLRWSEQ